MNKYNSKQSRRKGFLLILTGILLGILLIFAGNKGVHYSSTDKFCASCHVHPHSTQSWKRSTHHDNKQGIIVHCVDCHLPPQGEGYLREKAITGMRDVYGKLFKDESKFNWEEKSRPQLAVRHTFQSSCISCHQNIFPIGLSEEGKDAHLYYSEHEEELHCIKCHIQVGHYSDQVLHAKNVDFGIQSVRVTEVYDQLAVVEKFENFTEFIRGSSVSFNMIAIPSGTFLMGSPDSEPYRNPDEGPVREVSLNRFFMAETEVTWDQFLEFFKQTGSEGKTADAYLNEPSDEVDGVTGPTPPWGAPNQGWGDGNLPAITMSFHAAEVYCHWLTEVTGRKYRLPTEAEWEYAARGGTTGAYYFEGNPKDFSELSFRNRLFGADTAVISSNIWYNKNSMGRSGRPEGLKKNPFGLVNILGNVAEFCQDYYAPDAYALYPDGLLINPTGPAEGEERVIRGGSFLSGAEQVRSAAREHTETKAWLVTDPQIPKSIWWYTDCINVGFRVVCEAGEIED